MNNKSQGIQIRITKSYDIHDLSYFIRKFKKSFKWQYVEYKLLTSFLAYFTSGKKCVLRIKKKEHSETFSLENVKYKSQ